MGVNFTDYDYPFVPTYQDADAEGEEHYEGEDESIKSMVKDADHPLFSPSGLKNLINQNRLFGNTTEKTISGDIPEKVIKDLLDAAYKNKFPFEILVFAADFAKKLDDRSDAGDAQDLAEKLKGYANELIGTLGRQPTNSEVFMASVFEGAGTVKTILENAQNKPEEDASPLGSKSDDIVFYKQKVGEKTIRNNAEVYRWFKNRMVNGADVFPYFPLGKDSSV